MSGPVPSPSMYGIIGWSGTRSLPSEPIVIFSPLPGTLIVLNAICLDTCLCFESMRALRAVVPTARLVTRSKPNHIANGKHHGQSADSMNHRPQVLTPGETIDM